MFGRSASRSLHGPAIQPDWTQSVRTGFPRGEVVKKSVFGQRKSLFCKENRLPFWHLFTTSERGNQGETSLQSLHSLFIPRGLPGDQ